MSSFRIYRLKDSHYQQFRWASQTAGAAQVKPRDYEPGGAIEATGAYSAWSELRERGEPLRVGDLLESESGELRIFKYVGLEEAHWVLPEPKPDPEGSGSAAAPDIAGGSA